MDLTQARALLFSRAGYTSVTVFVAAIIVLRWGSRADADESRQGNSWVRVIVSAVVLGITAYLASGFADRQAGRGGPLNETFDMNPAAF